MPGPIDRATIARSPDAWSFAGATGRHREHDDGRSPLRRPPADNTQRNYPHRLPDRHRRPSAPPLRWRYEMVREGPCCGARENFRPPALVPPPGSASSQPLMGTPGQPSGDPYLDGRWTGGVYVNAQGYTG